MRALHFPWETAVYGVSYAFLKYLIRSPEPLDGAYAWEAVTRDAPAPIDWFRLHWPIKPMRPLVIAAKMRQDHARGIHAHYDVSNDFYKLFLDRKYMFYSCADFHRQDETLEEAQQHKADFILNLINPRPGEDILELGCGWGPMLKRIEEAGGDKASLHGLTLSKEQVAYNDQHNHYQVEYDNFITRDYPREAFDCIYSIGAWEHVRQREIPQLLDKLYAALRPGGRLVKHFFCRVNDDIIAPAACAQIYFPGSMGSSYRFHARAWEKAGFRIAHRSIHDYRLTLRAWFDRLVANREQALEIVDVATYNRYVTFFPTSWRYFNDNMGMVTRWVLEKPRV